MKRMYIKLLYQIREEQYVGFLTTAFTKDRFKFLLQKIGINVGSYTKTLI